MATIRWTLQSRQDLTAIRDFIARDALDRALRFVEAIANSAFRLERFPFSGEAVAALFREDIR
ncbi:MAG: type II toxin-antitoxin system RelE/ParE family toxin [Pirellulales bacterium]